MMDTIDLLNIFCQRIRAYQAMELEYLTLQRKSAERDAQYIELLRLNKIQSELLRAANYQLVPSETENPALY